MKQVFSLSFALACSENRIFRFIEENVRALALKTFVSEACYPPGNGRETVKTHSNLK